MRPFEYLFLRQLKFDYISPPICEALFSSTGEPTILLETFERQKIQGLELEVSGGVNIRWTAFPGALCYSVYQADGPEGPWVVVAECVENNEYPTEVPFCYAITVITDEGESELSDPICPESVTCPVWLSDPGGVGTLNCGDDLTLVAEATLDPVEGDLVYTWTKDDVILLQETRASGSGPSTLTKADLVSGDAGTYLLSVVYTPAEGDPCELTTSYTLTVENCGGGGCSANADTSTPPDHFLIKVNEDALATYTFTHPTDLDFDREFSAVVPAGKKGVYLIRYKGGGQGLKCDHFVDTNWGLGWGEWQVVVDGDEDTESWTPSAWQSHLEEHYGYGLFPCGLCKNWVIRYTAFDFWAPNLTDLETTFLPAGNNPVGMLDNFTFVNVEGEASGQIDEGVEIKLRFSANGMCPGIACSPDGCDSPPDTWSGVGSSWEIIRYGYWLDEPDYIRIKNYNVFLLDLGDPCASCSDASIFTSVWDGAFHKYKYVDDNLVYGVDDAFADVSILGKRVDATTSYATTKTKVYWASGVWYCDIYCKTGGGNQLLWRGKKVVGQTPVGTYDRDIVESMCYSNPTCIEIEEFDPFA